MKKTLLLSLLVLPFFFLSGCGEEAEKPQRTAKQQLSDKKDDLYRKLAKIKETIMDGDLEGWRAKLDSLWIYGDIIDPQISEYMDRIRRMAVQKEKEEKDGRPKSDLIVDPQIDANITATEEILTAYLKEILTGINAGTLVKWELSLDKVYLHGSKLTEKHYVLIKEIEAKGEKLNNALKEQKKADVH